MDPAVEEVEHSTRRWEASAGQAILETQTPRWLGLAMSYQKTLTAVLGASLLLLPSAAVCQSLGEVARKLQREREEHPRTAVQVYTNDSIPESPRNETAPAPHSETVPVPPGAQENPASPASQPAQSNAKSKIKSKEYWQDRFTVARSILSRAKEEQQLVEDELSLLQIQQVRELDPNRAKELTRQVSSKRTALELKREATRKAEKALKELRKEFEDSGAPADWIKDSDPH